VSFNSESLPVELNGVSYLIDTEQYRRTTVPVARQQRDNSKEPGENTLDTTGAWVRSQTDWSYGAGQLYLDKEDSDRRRFYSSHGVDVWTKGQISLLPVMETPGNTPTFTTGDIFVESVTNASGTEYIYVAQANKLYWATSPAGLSPAWDSSSGITVGGTVTSITSDEANIYLGFDGSIVAETIAVGASGSTSAFGSLDPNLIKICAGRIIAADDNAIYELDAAGAKATSSLDYTLPLSTSKWVDATAGANGIYAAANTDNTGSIYYIGVNSTNGALNAPTIAGSLPKNETVNKVLAYAGLLGIATSKGFRLALINEQTGSITLGPVIDTGGAAYALEADGKFMWWGANYGLCYRADLSVFTDTLVPAYAADLVSSVSSTTSDIVNSITRLPNAGTPKLFIGVKQTGQPAILQREHRSGNKVSSGWLIAGEVTWSTVVPKFLRSGVIDLDRSQFENSKTAYQGAGVDYTDPDTSYTLGAETTTPVGKIRLIATNNANTPSAIPSTTGTLVTGVPVKFDFSTPTDNVRTSISYDVKVELEVSATSPTESPVCHDWQCTAVAVPRRVDEIILPVVLQRDVVSARGSGIPKRFDSSETFTRLRNLMENGEDISYQEGDRVETVTIERLEMQPDRLSDNGAWWEGTLLVRLLTVPS